MFGRDFRYNISVYQRDVFIQHVQVNARKPYKIIFPSLAWLVLKIFWESMIKLSFAFLSISWSPYHFKCLPSSLSFRRRGKARIDGSRVSSNIGVFGVTIFVIYRVMVCVLFMLFFFHSWFCPTFMNNTWGTVSKTDKVITRPLQGKGNLLF